MKADQIFYPVLVALLAYSWLVPSQPLTSVAAYYANGDKVVFVPEVATQSVRSVSGGAIRTWSGCTVADAGNWSCPEMQHADGTPDPAFGFYGATDGEYWQNVPGATPTTSWSRYAWARSMRWIGTHV